MAKILALETSSDACSVALNIDGQVSEIFIVEARSHSKKLLPMIDEILVNHQMTLKDLDAIAFSRGPGSFTGLRICIGLAQGLAFGAKLPVIAVSTLEAMATGAQRLLNLGDDCAVLPAFDARMSEVYWAAYEQQGTMACLTDEYVMCPTGVADTLSAIDRSSWVGVGPGWHYEALQAVNTSAIYEDFYPHAFDVAVLADAKFQQGEVLRAQDAEPIYLRDTISWKKRQRIRPPQ